MSIREILEGPLEQGADESLVYTITTTNWVSAPTTPTVQAWSLKKDGADDDRDEDVTSTVIPGAASANGDVITLPSLKSLTAKIRYRIEVKFIVNGNIFECYFIIMAEK